jgi:hypothetical protein
VERFLMNMTVFLPTAFLSCIIITLIYLHYRPKSLSVMIDPPHRAQVSTTATS